MENMLSKEIKIKVEEIVEIIKNSSEYKEYLLLEEKMKNHSRIPKLIEEIKKSQKELVRLQTEGKNIEEKEKVLSTLEKELLEIPLYNDFIDAQKKLNEVFSLIKETMDNIFQL